VLIRVGLLAALVAFFVVNVWQIISLTLDVRHWSAAGSNQTIALIVALTVFAFARAKS
jgi:hypothetical protein